MGEMPVSQITSANVLACLRKIEAEGHHETARRVKQRISAVCCYAVAVDAHLKLTRAARLKLTHPL